ncbi:MAG TPA: TonB-dependent receptor [Cyclobacteriaceae bacterium]|nr:TonB-dependent receptor [Cyclobacteriaceae bacterium]
MKKILLTLAIMLVGLYTFAQSQISGSVRDADTGEPLYGANVVLVGTRVGTVVDETGHFTIQNVSANKHILRVSYLGFSSSTLEVQAPAQNLDIRLKPLSILTEEFIVSATRARETTPTTFQSLDKEQLSKNNLGQDLPFLLNYTPSVITHSDAGSGIGYTGMRIRGTDQTRINVTVNGIPINDAESHGVFWVNMPDFASSVDNLQIQRGVGTSTNGAATFGASINIQTDTRKDEAYAETENSFGSFNSRKHTVRVGSGLLNNRWAVDARLSRIASDGYMDRAFSDLQSYFVSGGYYGDNHVFKLNVFSGKEQTYQSWNGVPESLLATNRTYNSYTYENETDNYKQDHYQFIYTGSLGNSWKVNAALHYTAGRGYYEQYREDDELENYNLAPIEIGGQVFESTDIIRRRWLDNDFYGGVFSFNYISDDGVWDIIFGGGANRYDGNHFGEIIWSRIAANTDIRHRYYENTATKDDSNLYLKATHEVAEGLYLFGDLQYRLINYRFEGINSDLRTITGNQNYNFFNPKLGISYERGGHTWYASYAVANREPVRDDFTDNPITELPRPEKLSNIEAGLRARGTNFEYSANLYYMDYRDQLILTGQINNVGAYIRENVANSYRAGIELQGAYQFTPSWAAGGNLAFSRNKIDAFTEYIDDYSGEGAPQQVVTYSDTDIAFSPSIVAAAHIDFKPVKNFEISWLSKYVDKQYLDNSQRADRQLDAYFVNDLRLKYAIQPKLVREMEFSFLVNNIFNHLYEPNGYTFSYYLPGEVPGGRELVTENYYYPMAGTNFMAGVNIRF